MLEQGRQRIPAERIDLRRGQGGVGHWLKVFFDRLGKCQYQLAISGT